MPDITADQLRELISHLQGTCESLGNAVYQVCGDDYDEDDLTMEQHSEIDEAVFECAQCGWWCETSELEDGDGDCLCSGCYADNHPEEEDD